MALNYLQRMAGSLGSGMGRRGMGVDPRRRMAQQLMAQGVDTSPAHLGTGIGRLGKALAAAYMMRQSEDQEKGLMQWMTAQQPDRFRQPTREEAFKASPDLRGLEIASDVQWGSGQDQVHPDGDKGKSPPIDPQFETDPQFEKDFPPVEVTKEESQIYKEMYPNYESELEEAPQEISFPYGQRDYAQELASGMKAYQGAEANQISDPRTRMEWLRDSASGKEGNPLIRRMLQNMMFSKMQQEQEESVYQRRLKEKRADTKTASDIQESQFKTTTSIQEKRLKQQGWKDSTRPAGGGLTQRILINPSTREERTIGEPYDAKLMSQEAVDQQAQIFGAKKAAMSPLQEKQVEKIDREEKRDVQEIKTIKLKDRSALQDFKRKTETLTKTIADAESMINTYSTGFKGGVAQYLPWSTDRSRLDDYLTTLKANLGFDSLQKMRDNSATGGALGQVSEMENKLLQSINGALNPKNPGVMQANLDRIKELYPQVLIEKTQVYQDTYGEAYDKPRDGRVGDTAGGGTADMVYDPVTKKLVPNRRQQ